MAKGREGGKPIDAIVVSQTAGQKPGILDRVKGALAYAITGKKPEDWFGPGDALATIAPQEVQGRRFDYNVFVNTSYQPRSESGENRISFRALRALADPTQGGFDLLRLAIETRKDQMAALRWKIVDIEDEDEAPGEGSKADEADPVVEGEDAPDGSDESTPPKDAKAPPFGAKAPAQKLAKGFQPFGGGPKGSNGSQPSHPFGSPANGSSPFAAALPPKPEPKAPPKKVRSKEARAVEKALRRPDGKTPFRLWQRMVLEDLLVIDAPTVYVSPRSHPDVPTVKRAEVIDGATIKLLLQGDGRSPEPPEPAFQQVLKGVPAVDYTTDELIYLPRNVAIDRIYGMSPVEQVITTINIALRRQLTQLQYYTEGNVPEALCAVPETWTPAQIEEFQAMWDALLEGDTAARRHMKFVPGNMDVTFTRDPTLKDTFDEWLARIICYAFSISPQALIAQMNRATAETASEQAALEGLEPLKLWFKDFMDAVIRDVYGVEGVEFAWEDTDITDPKVKSEVWVGLVGAGIMTKDEAREAYGKEPLVAEDATPGGDASTTDQNGKPLPPDFEEGQEADEGDEPPAPPAPPMPAAKLGKGTNGRTRARKRHGVRLLKRAKPTKKREAAQVEALRKAVAAWLTAIRDALAAEIRASASKLAKMTSQQFEAMLETTMSRSEILALEKKLGATLRDISVESAASAMRSLGTSTADLFAQANDEAIAWADAHAGELITQIGKTTRQKARDLVVTGEQDGWTNDELANALWADPAFAGPRAEMVARTEFAMADVQGNLAGWKATGRVDAKRWIVGAGCCPACDELDGEEVPIDDAFSSGDDGPPAHPNCRCDVLPVLGSGDVGEDVFEEDA